MFANNTHMQKTMPVSTVQSGGFYESFNTGLNDALNAWMQVEQIKAVKSASGQDQIQAQVTPELENGATVLRDQPLSTQTQKQSLGVEIHKPLMIASLGLLGLALFMRFNGAR